MENNQPAANSTTPPPANTYVSDHKEININPSSMPNTSTQAKPVNNLTSPPTSPSSVPIPPKAPETTMTEMDFKEKDLKNVQSNKQVDETPSKDYFLPINTVTQRRSLKISVGLTFVILFLAFVLIDLMLDSGIVLLFQKLPHTHIFNAAMLG